MVGASRSTLSMRQGLQPPPPRNRVHLQRVASDLLCGTSCLWMDVLLSLSPFEPEISLVSRIRFGGMPCPVPNLDLTCRNHLDIFPLSDTASISTVMRQRAIVLSSFRRTRMYRSIAFTTKNPPAQGIQYST